MSKEMVISANPHETRVAIMEEGLLCEYYVEREKEFALVGSIYKGRVTRVLPGMQSSFVDIGLDSDAFLYVSDFLEGIEDLDDHISDKPAKAADASFAPAASAAPAAEYSSAPASAPTEPVSGGLEALPGESISRPGPGASADSGNIEPGNSIAASGPSYHSSGSGAPHSQDRGRFDRGRRGGRDFGGGRGGRGGRGRFNRGGGRPGGNRGGDRRFGRELPPSKFASHRPYDDSPADASVPEGHISTILPGESLARHRDKPADDTSQASAEATALTHEPGLSPSVDVPPDAAMSVETGAHHDAPELPISTSDTAEASHDQPHESAAPGAFESSREHRSESRHDDRRESRYGRRDSRREGRYENRREENRRDDRHDHQSDSSQPFAAGLEPLPGESLSKWKSRPAETPHAEAAAPAPVAEPEHDAEMHEPEELSRAPVPGEMTVADLSPEEAATLAEHVAEAQEEIAERDAEERGFAAADELAGAVHDAVEGLERREIGEAAAELDAQDAADDAAEIAEEEESELEEEEESAENEGMLAPSSESESVHDQDTIAADAGAMDENAQPREQQPFQAQVRGDQRARMQHPRRGGRDRGRRDDRGGRRPQHGRPHHGHHHGHHGHSQQRRPQLIADMLKQGQEIIVQIAKEPLGKKGARITSHVALPGRFLVYMPTLDHTGVSRKIASAEERSRLRHLVNDAKGAAGGGFIVRTAAAAAAPEEVRADVEFLTKTWSEIKSKSEQKKAPSLLHRDLNLVQRLLRDHMSNDYTAIWVDQEEEYTKVVDFMSRFQPALVSRVKLYTKDTPVFEEFGIQQEIDKGLRPKVWLKSGGYIVINHTEALVAIDVNTGKFVGKGSNRLEDTIVRTNAEAAKEIVRQMRLRDLGGIIVIDFIDMEERRNRDKVMAALEDALRADKAPSKVLRFNEFGLVAITRKRTKQALERMLSQPCPYCTGSGMVKSVPTLCYEIQTEANKMAPELTAGTITLRVHPEIGKALKTRESSLIDELEQWTKKTVIIQADPTLHWEQYDIY
jgi:Rne/Rng family ribonuclease